MNGGPGADAVPAAGESGAGGECDTDRGHLGRRRAAALLALLLAASGVLYAVGITWGLPSWNGWSADELHPDSWQRAIDPQTPTGWHARYPPLHFRLLHTLSLPLRRVVESGAVESGAVEADPFELNLWLTLMARGVSLLMALATLVGGLPPRPPSRRWRPRRPPQRPLRGPRPGAGGTLGVLRQDRQPGGAVPALAGAVAARLPAAARGAAAARRGALRPGRGGGGGDQGPGLRALRPGTAAAARLAGGAAAGALAPRPPAARRRRPPLPRRRRGGGRRLRGARGGCRQPRALHPSRRAAAGADERALPRVRPRPRRPAPARLALPAAGGLRPRPAALRGVHRRHRVAGGAGVARAAAGGFLGGTDRPAGRQRAARGVAHRLAAAPRRLLLPHPDRRHRLHLRPLRAAGVPDPGAARRPLLRPAGGAATPGRPGFPRAAPAGNGGDRGGLRLRRPLRRLGRRPHAGRQPLPRRGVRRRAQRRRHPRRAGHRPHQARAALPPPRLAAHPPQPRRRAAAPTTRASSPST